MSVREIPEELLVHPSVFAVEDEYQIMVPVDLEKGEFLVSARVGENEYFYETNGIRPSATELHRICIPMEELDANKSYTVILRKIIVRKEYFTQTEKPKEYSYSFRPIEKETDIRIYHLADTHNYVEAAIKTALIPGKPDLLVMNGDIAHGCSAVKDLMVLYRITSGVTEGEIPCVFSRGNHDLRGKLAERIADYTPTRDGYSYYTFRLGSVWGVVMDCGEDKVDCCDEYGYTVACHQFRLKETKFLKNLSGYDDPLVKYRLVVCHNPFIKSFEPKFDIEIPLFTEWAKILKETVKPHVMLSGHLHECMVIRPGDPLDVKGTPCPVIVASNCIDVDGNPNGHLGGTITLNPDKITVVCNDSKGELGMKDTILL